MYFLFRCEFRVLSLSFAATPRLRCQLESLTASKLLPATTPHLQPRANAQPLASQDITSTTTANQQPRENPCLQLRQRKGIPLSNASK